MTDFISYANNFLYPYTSLFFREEYKFFKISAFSIKNISHNYKKKEFNIDYSKDSEIVYNPLKNIFENRENIFNAYKYFEDEFINELSTISNEYPSNFITPAKNKAFYNNFLRDNIKIYFPKNIEKSEQLDFINDLELNYKDYNFDDFIENKDISDIKNNIEDKPNILKIDNIKLIPIEIPSKENKETLKLNKIDNIFNLNYLRNLNEINSTQIVFEQKIKESKEFEAFNSSFRSSTLVSDEIDGETRINEIYKTKKKKNSYSSKYIMKYEDYIKNYIKINLLHDAKNEKEAKTDKEDTSIYKSLENNKKNILEKKYEDEIFIKEKVEKSFIEKTKKQFIDEPPKLIKLRVSNSNHIINNNQPSSVKDKNQKISNEENYQAKKTSPYNKFNKLDQYNKSKFKIKQEKNLYDFLEDKENIKNIDNLNIINFPFKIQNKNIKKNIESNIYQNQKRNKNKFVETNENNYHFNFSEIQQNEEKHEVKTKNVKFKINKTDFQENYSSNKSSDHNQKSGIEENQIDEDTDLNKLINENLKIKCNINFPRLKCWEEVSFPKKLSAKIKKKLLGKIRRNNDMSFDLIESNISNFSSNICEQKDFKKEITNSNSDNKDAYKGNKSPFAEGQFEKYCKEILANENNDALIIYDFFNEKNDCNSNLNFSVDNFSDNIKKKKNKNDSSDSEKENFELKNNNLNMNAGILLEKIKKDVNRKISSN